MPEQIVGLLLDESKWLSIAMLLSLVAVAVRWARRRPGLPHRIRILELLNLFYGSMIGIMALGHLLGVTIKLAQGTLAGSPWTLYPLGLVLAIPAWWLALRAGQLVQDERWGTRLVALNAWLGLGLLALGLPNLPLAGPAVLNIAYQFHSRRAVGWVIVSAAVVSMLALFIGSLVFFASGQSFEQFSGME